MRAVVQHQHDVWDLVGFAVVTGGCTGIWIKPKEGPSAVFLSWGTGFLGFMWEQDCYHYTVDCFSLGFKIVGSCGLGWDNWLGHSARKG